MGEKKRVESEKLTTKYLHSMFAFFKAKNSKDRFKKAEDALILQRKWGFANAIKFLLISYYIFVVIRLFSITFKNKTFITLPYLGHLGWGGTLILFIPVMFILQRCYNHVWKKEKRKN